ncbi:MAG: carboxymuconolactone decarboxylase family protein [Lapillicoccus sp.]
MTSPTARIPLQHPQTAFTRAMTWWSRRTYGDVLEPGLAMLHHRKVLLATISHERKVAKFNTLDPTIKALAQLVAAATIGCSWCMDFGFWVSHHEGVPREKLEAVPRWQTADVYTDLERRAMAYAEAMSVTPLEVTDDMVEGLRESLSDAAFIELTAMIALENSRSRTNGALGLTSQGFADRCERQPVAAPVAVADRAAAG